jgi:hypothetical protein
MAFQRAATRVALNEAGKLSLAAGKPTVSARRSRHEKELAKLVPS